MNKILTTIILLPLLTCQLFAQEERPNQGATEKTPSRSEYFSWINNTNEGATEEQTMINLEFFKWLHDEYGMILDIYAFDAGAIDGKRFYGSIHSDRFKSQFPNGFDPMYEKAKSIGTRLGVWGGPDGFGDTPEEEKMRTEQMVSLCRDYEFALFKFDAVCGPLRPEKEDAFINMMIKCREYSPDLILLNHRLGLERAQQYATTFLWEGAETYVDIFSVNPVTAPHHRAGALSRDLVPNMQRLTEDHGVCISSCLDYWDDDLVLQAFNRNLILSPQIYGSPWFLRDEEFPKLARIFNLHRKYRDIMVNGMVLPEENYGIHAVSRGDENTRIITLRNLSWKPITYKVKLDAEIGLKVGENIELRQFHPNEKILGTFTKGEIVTVNVLPFRSCLLVASNKIIDEPGVTGIEYEVVKNVPDQPVEIIIKGLPGTKANIGIKTNENEYSKATLDGIDISKYLSGKTLNVKFDGEPFTEEIHRFIGDATEIETPSDAKVLFDATCFAASNNALEIQSLQRSGETNIPQVKEARDAFLNQEVLNKRGIWDRNLFDGDMNTAFWPSRKYKKNLKVNGGSFRIDLGDVTDVDEIILHVPDEYSLQPLLKDEANYAEISTDLENWETLIFMAGETIKIEIGKPVRYIRIKEFPDRIAEIEGYKDGKTIDRSNWRASNLFSHPSHIEVAKTWKHTFSLNQIVENNYLCVAINGEHGKEGAYAAIKVDGEYVGAPDRAVSFPSNTWEYVVWSRDKNYTYYFPLKKEWKGKQIEVFVLGLNEEKLDLKPEIWLTAYPISYEKKLLTIE